MIRAGKRFRDRRLSPSGRGGTAPGSERFPGRGGLGNSDLCWLSRRDRLRRSHCQGGCRMGGVATCLKWPERRDGTSTSERSRSGV